MFEERERKDNTFETRCNRLVLFQTGPIAPLKQSQGTEQTIKACWSVEFSEAFVFALPWQEDEAGSQLGIWKQFFRYQSLNIHDENLEYFLPICMTFRFFGVPRKPWHIPCSVTSRDIRKHIGPAIAPWEAKLLTIRSSRAYTFEFEMMRRYYIFE